MFLHKKLTREPIEERNWLDELYWLDWRFNGPKWMYIRSELSHYVVKRMQLEKLIIEHEGQYVLDKYENDRKSEHLVKP
jgi:hypothetical protein